MSSNGIRVQLPGGDSFAPAFAEAASKTAARCGHPKKATAPFRELIELSVALLNSGNASMISLEMFVHEDSLQAKLVGKGCTSPTKKLVKELDVVAAKKARSFTSKATKTAYTINFEI